MNSLVKPVLMALVLVGCSHGEKNKAISWHQIQSGQLFPGRTTEGQRIYDEYLAELKAQNLSPEFSVYRNIFGMDNQQAAWCVEKGCPDQYRLVTNNYSYWLEDGVYQLLMFSTDPYWSKESLEQKSRELLRLYLPELFSEPAFEWVIHINPPSNRSIKGLAHAHIFLRDKLDAPSRLPALINRLSYSKSADNIPMPPSDSASI